MARLAKCPRQHVWSPAAADDDSTVLTCPVCGEAGATLAMEPIDSTIVLKTLDAKFVPPVVDDVSAASAGSDERVGTRGQSAAPAIPGYEVVRELGRGGMGVVYLARHYELKRLVALKMILAGAHADSEILARFRREAETVARLQHPGITQIHDVGEHEGCPYLALEYVDGSNLAYQLAGATLAPRAAAALIENIARTVHYAHRRGVLHRDLTPRNILLGSSNSSQGIKLLGADPNSYEPKITDFGLAKELGGDAGQTQTGVVMGTPSYMSPEQAQGVIREIGPATDIHALGAILYETLTGRPPFVAATSFDTIKQLIEREPVPPSRLQPGVPRDLETICLKCLAKDPLKRYGSAEELADDLHRFLATEPILARRVPWYERAWKWARRRPAVAALLLVIVIAIAALTAGGVLYSARIRDERDRAENNFQLAMRAVDEMLTEVGDVQLASEPRMEEKRKALLAKALVLYQEFLKQKTDDPRVRFETAGAYRRMADILRLLGDYSRAGDAYDQAIRLLMRLQNESSDNTNYRRQMAYCENMRGESLRILGQLTEANAAYQRAQTLLEKLAAEHPDEALFTEELARTLYNRGILSRQSQHPIESESQFRQSVSLLIELRKRAPPSPDQKRHLARAYLNLGTVIPAQERFADAKDADDRAIENLADLNKTFPDNPDFRHELGVAYNNLGNLFARTGRPEAAKTAYDQALERFRALAHDYPKVPAYRQELANSYNSVGGLHQRARDFTAASEDWKQAAALLKDLVAEHAEVAAYQGDLAVVMTNLGLAHHAQSQWPQARADFNASIDLLKRVVDLGPSQVQYKQALRDDYQNLAEVLLLAHDHAGAAESARSLAKVFADNGRDRYVAACFLARCAAETRSDDRLDHAGREAAAQRYADEAVAAMTSAVTHGFNDAEQVENDRHHALQALTDRHDFQDLVARIHASQPDR